MKVKFFKKQLVMVALVLALAVAVYLNWRLAGNERPGAVETGGAPEATTETNTQAETDKYYGEALFVSNPDDSSADFFTEARLNRTKTRDEALEALQKSLQQVNMTQAEKDAVTEKLSFIAKSIAIESNIESLIKAKGFAECVVFINEDKVNIVVTAPADGLSVSQVSQIKEIVLSECSVAVQSITIVEIK